METVRQPPPSTRTVLAWGFIGIVGVICLVIGIGKGAIGAPRSFDGVKFAVGGIILLAIATYKVVRGTRRR